MGAQDINSSVFFKLKESPGQSRSHVIFLDENGLAVVVTNSLVELSSGKFKGKAINLIAHDPVSRLSLIRVPLEPGVKTKPVDVGASLELKQGSALYLGLEGEALLSRFVSRESEYKEKPLPLELFRVHHQAEVNLGLGHPIFDSAGRLVAINYRKAAEFGNGSFAYPVEAMQRLQNATVIDGVVQRSWFGVELLASDPFAVVQAVRQSSPAAKAGIVKGDILVQIGPRAIHHYADAINAFFYLREGEDVAVKFLRETSVMEVTVTPELVPTALPAPPVKEEPKSEEEPDPELNVEAAPRVEPDSEPEPSV